MALLDFNKSDAQSPFSYPKLAELLFAADKILQRRYGVIEYSANPSCIFRLQICPATRDVVLRDGTRLRRGQRVAKLHYWNEHMPALQEPGTLLAWAHEFTRRLELSLSELAQYLASRPDLRDVEVVAADVAATVKEECGRVVRIMQRYGFEASAEEDDLPSGEILHRFGENILISLMVFVRNAKALRINSLRRARLPIFVSRKTLERRFGLVNNRASRVGVS